jgi:hypothetical protein
MAVARNELSPLFAMLRVARSPDFVRAHAVVRRDGGCASESLAALLLVEMSVRGKLWRAAEWIAWWLGRSILPGELLPRTRGPLQLQDAPFCFADAVQRAVERLRDVPEGDDAVARVWNGAASRQAGALIGYTSALRLARRVLEDPPAAPKAGAWRPTRPWLRCCASRSSPSWVWAAG